MVQIVALSCQRIISWLPIYCCQWQQLLVNDSNQVFVVFHCKCTDDNYDKLLEMWLPSNDPPPQIYHGGSGGHELLLTDTVKIKMIKSSNKRLAEFGIVLLLW